MAALREQKRELGLSFAVEPVFLGLASGNDVESVVLDKDAQARANLRGLKKSLKRLQKELRKTVKKYLRADMDLTKIRAALDKAFDGAEETRDAARDAGGPKLSGQVLIYPGLGGDMTKGSYVSQAEAPGLSTAGCSTRGT